MSDTVEPASHCAISALEADLTSPGAFPTATFEAQRSHLDGAGEGASLDEASITNEVVRLREWGTNRIHRLPEPPGDWYVGTSEACALRLADFRVSPMHAHLTYERQQWWMRDLDSVAGLYQDGVSRKEFALTPGDEVGIGPVTLVAESPQSISLREFCTRILGWTRDPGDVDHALRTIHFATTRRAALVLRGKGDLVPIAYALHRRTLGPDAPFVVCDSRRRTAGASVRSPANHDRGMSAFMAAIGGSLCVRSSRPPRDFSALSPLLHRPGNSVQLIVCLDRSAHCDSSALFAGPRPIQVPPLRERATEVPSIIKAYAREAIAALDASEDCFTDDDLLWVKRVTTSLPEIEIATLRVVAIRKSANLSNAAKLLGMAPVSLFRWLYRRSSPLAIGLVRTRRQRLKSPARL